MKWLVLMLAVFWVAPAISMAAMIEEDVSYNGWKCVKMSNDDAEVFIAPELAGRIIQYRTDGKDWLWVNRKLAGKVYPPEENDNMEVWKNYGGDKLWPAPQGWSGKGYWPGPGDPVIVRPHSYEILKKQGDEVSLKLTGSDKGGYAGVQFMRTIVLKEGSNRLETGIEMKNVSERTVSWGIWEVTQMDFSDQGNKKGERDWNEEAYLAVPMNPLSRWPEKYQVMFGLASSFNWQPDCERNLMIVRYQNFVGKLVMDVSAGWAAMVDPAVNQTFVQRFPYFEGAQYPDGGNFEIWVAGKGEYVHANKRRYAKDDPEARFVEMEPQGPKVTLEPGQKTELSVSWEVYQGGLEAVPEYQR